MANNRMWLRNKNTGQQVLLAKYYPSTDWYCYHEDLSQKLDHLFQDPSHLSGTMTGNNDYEIVYESIETPPHEPFTDTAPKQGAR
jgi:hypothetical protein